jgi:hypothetical protein
MLTFADAAGDIIDRAAVRYIAVLIDQLAALLPARADRP